MNLFFQGHFPGKPIFPGVLIIECAAQAAAVVYVLDEIFLVVGNKEFTIEGINTILEKCELKNKVGYLASIKNAKFTKVIKPGDKLNVFVRTIASSLSISEIEFKINVDKIKCCTGRMIVTKNVN